MVEEPPEVCLEVKPLGALVRDVVVGGFIGSRLGDTFLGSLRLWTGLLGAESLSFPAGFRIERIRLNPVVEDIAGCEESKVSR